MLCRICTVAMLQTLLMIVLSWQMVPSKGLGSSIREAFSIKPIDQFVKDKGYPFEEHEIMTDDDYILTYHRVPHGKLAPGHGHPVLLVHGILQSSALYLAMDDGLAYLLADAGFDVWLANNRGNTHSRRHKKLNPSWSKKFWDFSFDEMGRNDLPAAIEHILSVTGRESLTYMGFSMGNTMFWVFSDSWSSYMNKVDTMIGIAPIARPTKMAILHQHKTYVALSSALKTFNALHSYEVRPFRKRDGLFIRAACSRGENSAICNKLLGGLVGLYPDSLHYGDTLTSTQYMPAGTSIKTVRHFFQIGKKGIFQRFDYGTEGNQKHYGALTPPPYDLAKVTCPVFFITSDKDDFSAKEDVEWLAQQLPNPPETLFYDVVKDFNHLDFFYSKDVKDILYRPLVNFITERTKSLKK